MTVKARLRLAHRCGLLSANQANLLRTLHRFAARHGCAFPGVRLLAAKLGVCRRTVFR